MEKIVAFGNGSYSELANVWLSYISKLGLLDKVLIIALDNEIEKEISDFKVKIIRSPYHIKSKGLNGFWKFRCEVFIKILANYGSFVHSDLDAIWLKNPFDYIKNIESDLIFSQGTVYPRPMFDKYGFVACCGFFGIRDSNSSRLFLKILKSDVQTTGDDQVSVNKIIFNFLKSLEIKDIYYEKAYFANGQVFPLKCSNFPIMGKFSNFYGQELLLTILPHFLFPRLKKSINKSTIVAHPLAPKNNTEKIKLLKEINLLNS